ncbi:MAG: hypothetical protein KBT19_06975 [Lachnospiraceae bacterium]|nr:hypothetical protein [Candidatus Colinaster equi]
MKRMALVLCVAALTMSVCGCGVKKDVHLDMVEDVDVDVDVEVATVETIEVEPIDMVDAIADIDVEVEPMEGMPNPWVDTDENGIMQMGGVRFAVPEGAAEVIYRYLESENLSEMQFDLDGLHFCARIKPTAEWEDISGVYCDWTVEDECKVSEARLEGKCMRYLSEEETTDVCLWYDVVPGLMYSVTTTAADLDGFDIQAIAEAIYTPMQTEVP